MSFLGLILLFLSPLHALHARPLIPFQTDQTLPHLPLQEGEKSRLLDSSSSPYPIFVRFQTDQPNKYDEQNRREKTSFGQNHLIKMKEITDNHRKLMKEDASNDTQRAIKSEETEVGEDMVVMDYAQPHRKPPIHNERP